MKTTAQWLDAIKDHLSLPSDYAVAKYLGVTRAAVSRYRNGLSVFDEKTAIRVAELLDVQPFEVIASVNAESSRDERARHIWINALEIFSRGFRWLALPANACWACAPQV
ncbi:helix-turn-helix domain-containing protein [Burkholderia ambifaria]|uniref:helix-turn-helix domain-containing protein n=1 Tax=Burkholderia ambifaria TaxID=152480 RepID=UPI001589C498|nr:helix-turn-helix transcriptional regulator [Burkholderia ambifaria]